MILKCPDEAEHLEASLPDSKKGKGRGKMPICSAFDSSGLDLGLGPVPSGCSD